MSLYLPTRSDVDRLRQMLQDYERDVVWLRACHVYHLTLQSDQVAFEVVDANGMVLRDRTGMIRSHTWQMLPSEPSMFYGDQVHVCRDGDDVRVRMLAVMSDPSSHQPPIQVEWAIGA